MPAIIILFISSITMYKNYRTNMIEKQSELYFEAIEFVKNENYPEAEKILNKISNSKNSGYSDLSALQIMHLKNKGEANIDIKNISINKNPFLKDYFVLQKFNLFNPVKNIINAIKIQRNKAFQAAFIEKITPVVLELISMILFSVSILFLVLIRNQNLSAIMVTILFIYKA